MKKLLFLVLFIIPFYSFSQCPVKGDSPQSRLQTADSLKNRTIPGKTAVLMDVSQFVCANVPTGCGSDLNKFSPNTYVALTGYIVLVKYGGPETANCHSKNKSDMDFHVELASSPTEKNGKNIMVVELTKNSRGSITIDYLKTLVGKRVTVYGWIFHDHEHWANSLNSNPTGTNLWRATEVEVHPVFNVVLTPLK